MQAGNGKWPWVESSLTCDNSLHVGLPCTATFISLRFSCSKMMFSTKGNDNDLHSEHCAENYKGAWWYKACHDSNLNGLYLGGPQVSYADGINWVTFRGHYYSLKRTEMKVKPIGDKTAKWLRMLMRADLVLVFPYNRMPDRMWELWLRITPNLLYSSHFCYRILKWWRHTN